MAASSDWKPAYDFTISIGSVTPKCDSVEVAVAIGTFDATNQVSAGDYEFGVDVTRRDVRGSYLIDKNDVDSLTEGDLVAASYTDGIQDLSGSMRVTSLRRTGGARGAYKFAFEGTFTGAVVTTPD